ncbi:hypothetical protein [Nocardia sp. N2S4-5]|uniref:hypothetical protein n=1 Tax=Nocardia sp. N2S4-5 TaxID=3351565 RepID=UPI0037D4EDB1
MSARLAAAPGGSGAVFRAGAALAGAPRSWPEPDAQAVQRLRWLEARLSGIEAAFPDVAPEVAMCRLTCELLEGVWHWRVHEVHGRAPGALAGDEQPCDCALCANLPTPPARGPADYTWRRSDGRPLKTKILPYLRALDSVLTGGWRWTRTLNDADRDLGLRWRYEDDVLALHEYKRVIADLDAAVVDQRVRKGLAARFSVHGARALVVGLFAAYKRRVDEFWLDRHTRGAVSLTADNPLDAGSYVLLQLMDCLFWHVSPDTELWWEPHLAALVMCRVLDDMTDARADAVSGEINNFWLSAMPAHDKAVYAACAIAMIKFGCTPEARGLLWNSWLMPTTMGWLALTGRHALWFDGIMPVIPPCDARPAGPSGRDCPLCGLRPHSGAGLLTSGLALSSGRRPVVDRLGDHAADLVELCRLECPAVSPLLSEELAAFEALHGPWRGRVDSSWKILRRTYIAAALAVATGDTDARRARTVQVDSGAVGAEHFHALHETPTASEDTALLAYMFGCAHPHFLWNCLGCVPGQVHGDWLDG